MTDDTKYLECIYCGKEFEHEEVFIAFMDEEGFIIIAECMPCTEQREPCTKPERKDTGWCVLIRNYDHYEAQEVTGLH